MAAGAVDHFATLPSGVRICYQVFGDASDPAILFIAGTSSAMTQKTDELVRLLSPADDPHFVVRYDHRDTGLSSTFQKPADGSPAYALSDMVDDAVGLIRHLGLTSVHVVGASFGGPQAWEVAARLPDIVTSLALVLTSPTGREVAAGDGLPPVRSEGQKLLGAAYKPPKDPDDDEAWIRLYVDLDQALATRPPTEAEREESRRESEVTYRREKESGTKFTKFNHADASKPRWPRETLKLVKCPTVVIHAAEDQMFPMEHGEALRDDVQGATLVVLEDCGHEFPHRVRRRIADAILANAARGQEKRGSGN